MKVFSSTAAFDYSWEEVSAGNWLKYSPLNEKTPHVVGVDTLSRRVDPETGILRTERILTCKQSAPSWLRPFMRGIDTSYVHELSYVNPEAKTLTLCSTNMTWSDLLRVRETVSYSPCDSSPSTRTTFAQRAEITALCGGLAKIRNNIEGWTLERFQQNAQTGKEGMDMVLGKIRNMVHRDDPFDTKAGEQALQLGA